MLFRHIGFDTIVYTLTEIFYSDLQQIRIITVLMSSVCLNFQFLYDYLDLTILNHAACLVCCW